jgi:hypothetical protein
MSLMTALLAFLPALAARREPETETGLDPQIELAQAREGRKRAETERDNLLLMLVERDRVINRLVAERATTPMPPPLGLQPVFFPAPGMYPQRNDAIQHSQQNAQLCNQQALAQQQFLQDRQGWLSGLAADMADFCTCVPARHDALRLRLFNGED